MANIWRRQPGEYLRGGRYLIRGRTVDPSAQIANEFFEAVSGGAGDATATPAGVSGSSGIGSETVTGTALILAIGIATLSAIGAGVGKGNGVSQPAGVSSVATLGTVTATAGTSATATPVGVSTTSAIGQVTAVAEQPATAMPAGVSSVSAIGQAIAYAAIENPPVVIRRAYRVNAVAQPDGIQTYSRIGSVIARGGHTVRVRGAASTSGIGMVTAGTAITPLSLITKSAIGTAAAVAVYRIPALTYRSIAFDGTARVTGIGTRSPVPQVRVLVTTPADIPDDVLIGALL